MMNILYIFTLKVLRKLYSKVFKVIPGVKPQCEQDPDMASQIIYDALMADMPCMIARFGSNELNCLVNYLAIKDGKKNLITYIKGESFQWWWSPGIIKNLHLVGGFFPPQEKYLSRFCELMIQDIRQVDILGSWLFQESYFEPDLRKAKKIFLLLLDPFWASIPWTKALEGKKVLIVHPFAYTIEQQYKKRKLLFKNSLLPEFELKTIKAIQSLAGEQTNFADWFKALEWMKSEIDKQEYDICLIGAGAYGFPIAAHVKRMGRKAVHLGGSLQLMFGIRGKRWEDENYNSTFNYARLMNEYWVKPGDIEKPEGAIKVEGACYW